MARNDAKFQRRKPQQARSRATYDAVLEAAAQILQRDGVTGLNTNRVAERAGVSVGTLYQYFSDKEAILLAMAEQALERPDASFPGSQRALVEALIRTIETLLGGSAAASLTRAAKRVRLAAKEGDKLVRRLALLPDQSVLAWFASPATLRSAR